MNEYRDASDRLSFSFEETRASSYLKITELVATKFELMPVGSFIRGLDELFQDFKRGDIFIGLEWDNWSGYIVCANDKAAEPLAKEIANYISATFSLKI